LAARFCLQATIVVIASGYLPRRLPRLMAASELARFAVAVWSSGELVVLSGNADYVVIGRILGSTALGFYSIAWDLLRFIPDRLYKVVGRVALPLFSQIQDDDAQLRRHYCDFVGEISRILLPLMTAFAVAAPHVLQALYGARWIPAAGPVRALTPGLILVGVTFGIGSIYYAKARPVLDLYLHGAHLVLIVGTLVVVAPRGLIPASIVMSVVEGTIAIGGEVLVNSLISLGWFRLFKAVMPGIRNAALAAVTTEAGMVIASRTSLHGYLALIVIASLPALILGRLELPRLVRAFR
jgi:O-antigen/teichoic acid export membrane protein